VNDCNLALATDKRAEVMVQVTFSGSGYNPACIRVQEGTSVTFSGDFEVHPLVGGKVQGSAIPDPASPIPMTSIGMSVVATFPKAGDYGFYCANHYASRMMGAVFVDPASPPP
jgi:plastocyanin